MRRLLDILRTVEQDVQHKGWSSAEVGKILGTLLRVWGEACEAAGVTMEDPLRPAQPAASKDGGAQ